MTLPVIRSMFTGHRNHEQALWMMHTGLTVAGRADHRRLGGPTRSARLIKTSRRTSFCPIRAACLWTASATGRAVGGCRRSIRGRRSAPKACRCLNLKSRRRALPTWSKADLQFAGPDLNADHKARHPGELELDARISGFELAARMQLAATDRPGRIKRDNTDTTTLRFRTIRRRDPYGAPLSDGSAAWVERGVRFVQHLHGGSAVGRDTPTRPPKPAACCDQTDLPHCRIAYGPEAARPFGIDAGILGRRVRPDAGRPRARTAATIIPTASASGWPAAASKAARYTARRMISAIGRWWTAVARPDLPRVRCCDQPGPGSLARSSTGTTAATKSSPMCFEPKVIKALLA